MLRPVPGETKVKIEIFRGIRLWDLLVGFMAALMLICVVVSSQLNNILKVVLGLLIVGGAGFLIARISAGEPTYSHILRMLRYLVLPRRFERIYTDDLLYEKSIGKFKEDYLSNLSEGGEAEEKEPEKHSKKEKNFDFMENIIPFTGVSNGFIVYDELYLGSVIEIEPVEYRFMTEKERNAAIEQGFGAVLRSLRDYQAANIIKIDRPILYDDNLEMEYDKAEQLISLYEKAMMSEDELKSRLGIEYDRIKEIRSLCYDKKILSGSYYIAFFDSEEGELNSVTERAIELLREAGVNARRLDSKQLLVFLKYTNFTDFEERDIDEIDVEDQGSFALPEKVEIFPHHVRINDVYSYHYRVKSYPSAVDNAWMERIMSIPATKVVAKCRPVDREKAVRDIDRSLVEFRGKLSMEMADSAKIALTADVEGLEELLLHIREENESLIEMNIYVSCYDISRRHEEDDRAPSILPEYDTMPETISRIFSEEGFTLDRMDYRQIDAFVGSQVSALDPISDRARAMPSNTIAAMFPWIHPDVSDVGGMKLGSREGIPVFIDFFKRDDQRVNSNIVIIGKSGSGKSYATKHLLTNLAGDDSKIFILDPENEYSVLAKNLNGKVINLGNASAGRINPFHIMTELDDDEGDSKGVANSFATHLQFLEEFFKQILPDCDRDALEYLDTLVERIYSKKKITANTDFSKLSPQEYPIFDDLYDQVLYEFERTDNEYLHSSLRNLINYIGKFSTGGRNAGIWNGPSTITTESNFTVFNFQSMLANRNSTISNAQMLLVLKYIDNEIIKNRDYNRRHGTNRKVVVVIDEAHVFIDAKYPVALDFMFQLAKRIRKYNGMQIVITQNIKDFVGNEEIAAKSSAIINACQYSLIFPLAPNDMEDLCSLYEKAGGINEHEQEEILGAPRGQAFAILSPGSRSTIKVEPDSDTITRFEKEGFDDGYFSGAIGREIWDKLICESRIINAQSKVEESMRLFMEEEEASKEKAGEVRFSNISFSIEGDDKEATTEFTIGGKKAVFGKEEKSELPAADKDGFVTFTIGGNSPKPDIIEEAPKEELTTEAAPQPVKEESEAEDFDGERFMKTLLGEKNYRAMIDSIRQKIMEEMK